MGQPPSALTFQRLLRPVRLVEKAIHFPSGDQAAPPVDRVKNRSSTGIGVAPSAAAELIVLGSVSSRVSGESEAKALTNNMRSKAGAGGRNFKCISCIVVFYYPGGRTSGES